MDWCELCLPSMLGFFFYCIFVSRNLPRQRHFIAAVDSALIEMIPQQTGKKELSAFM